MNVNPNWKESEKFNIQTKSSLVGVCTFDYIYRCIDREVGRATFMPRQ